MLPLKILYDISMEISPDMPVYKGRDAKRPIFEVSSNHQTSSAYETRINMDMHTGTHLDAPLHMIKDGETMEYFTEDNIFNDCIVLDLRNVDDGITDDDIRGAVFQYINSDSFHTESSERNGQSKLKKPADQNFQSDRESNIEKAIRGKVVLLQTKNSFEKRESNF
ncbi:MAG: cyclase family protein, partial [Halanaerobiales bacterium]